MTKLQDTNERLSTLLRLIDAASHAEDSAEIARQAAAGLGAHYKAAASAVWLHNRSQLSCLYEHQLKPDIVRESVERVVSTGEPAYETIDWPKPTPALARELSILPLTVERAVVGALAVVTAAPLLPPDLLVAQAFASYLAARLQAAQAHQLADLRRIELAASNNGWNEFIGHAAHEIKNPLASVKGYADLLLRRTSSEPSDPFRKGLTIISQQTGRATELLSEMADTSRMDTDRILLTRRTVELGALLGRMVQEYQATTTQHTLLIADPGEPIEGQFDEQRLSQAIGAMLSNAIKFSPAGGPIRVELLRSNAPATPEVVISVVDHGVGIPAEEHREVFDRFKRGSNVRGLFGGLGLGLFKAREIAERHGGRMWLQSKLGAGTTSFLALPLN